MLCKIRRREGGRGVLKYSYEAVTTDIVNTKSNDIHHFVTIREVQLIERRKCDQTLCQEKQLWHLIIDKRLLELDFLISGIGDIQR